MSHYLLSQNNVLEIMCIYHQTKATVIFALKPYNLSQEPILRILNPTKADFYAKYPTHKTPNLHIS